MGKGTFVSDWSCGGKKAMISGDLNIFDNVSLLNPLFEKLMIHGFSRWTFTGRVTFFQSKVSMMSEIRRYHCSLPSMYIKLSPSMMEYAISLRSFFLHVLSNIRMLLKELLISERIKELS